MLLSRAAQGREAAPVASLHVVVNGSGRSGQRGIAQAQDGAVIVPLAARPQAVSGLRELHLLPLAQLCWHLQILGQAVYCRLLQCQCSFSMQVHPRDMLSILHPDSSWDMIIVQRALQHAHAMTSSGICQVCLNTHADLNIYDDCLSCNEIVML